MCAGMFVSSASARADHRHIGRRRQQFTSLIRRAVIANLTSWMLRRVTMPRSATRCGPRSGLPRVVELARSCRCGCPAPPRLLALLQRRLRALTRFPPARVRASSAATRGPARRAASPIRAGRRPVSMDTSPRAALCTATPRYCRRATAAAWDDLRQELAESVDAVALVDSGLTTRPAVSAVMFTNRFATILPMPDGGTRSRA